MLCASPPSPGPAPSPVQVHPHKHGSATLQVITASLLFIVEDDPRWLPDANGCAEVKQALRCVWGVWGLVCVWGGFDY